MRQMVLISPDAADVTPRSGAYKYAKSGVDGLGGERSDCTDEKGSHLLVQ